MQAREKIARFIEQKGRVRGPELCRSFGMSRQALHRHLRGLITEGRIEKTGSTRNAAYVPAGRRDRLERIRRTCSLAGLAEDRVYDELAVLLRLDRAVSKPVERIINYAFTELLNNAIDHSGSEQCSIDFRLDPYLVEFVLRDHGIGVFHSIAEKLSLRDEQAAAGELIKGKTTTMPSRHSGEGLFFTSKAADIFTLRSHRMELEIQTENNDMVLREKRHIKGTEARFKIRRRSRRRLEHVFERYSPKAYDFRFERTRVYVKLFQEDYTSRSEAKRMLANLDRFSEIELDFSGVKSLGQGFVDEVFRVFPHRHPHVRIDWTCASGNIEPMIRHVVDNINQ